MFGPRKIFWPPIARDNVNSITHRPCCSGSSFSLADLAKALETVLKPVEQAVVSGQQAVVSGQESLAGQIKALRELIAAGQSESVSISDVNSDRWGVIQAHAHLSLELRDGPPAPTDFRTIPPFGWLDSPEAGQSDLYMQYLRNNIRLGSRDLDWLRGDSCRDLLTSSSTSGFLPYTVRGTCDAAIVTRRAIQIRLYRAGLAAVMEFKRVTARGHLCQALAQVLTANILSSSLRPFGVLTDLNDDWLVIYMDSTVIYVIKPPDRRAAVALIEVLLSERSCADGDDGGDGKGRGDDQGGDGGGGGGGVGGTGFSDADAIGGKAAGGDAPGAKRRRLIQGAAGEGASGSAKAVPNDVANLADLDGFLPEGECRQAQLEQALQVGLVRLAELCGV